MRSIDNKEFILVITVPPAENRIPIIAPRENIHVLVDVQGTWREVFCIFYTKKGDLMTLTRVASTRLRRGVARIGAAGLEFEVDPVDVAVGEGLEKRKYFTIHPSIDGEPGKATPVVNGLGGCQEIRMDLRTIKYTEAVMIHRMTDPARYPEATEAKCDLKFGNVFRNDASPEFHVFVTPMKGQTPVDQPVPFIPGFSANFIAEPVGMSTRHLLFQIRLGHQPRITFPAEHEFLIPAP